MDIRQGKCDPDCKQCMYIKGWQGKPKHGKIFVWCYTCKLNRPLIQPCNKYIYDPNYKQHPFNKTRSPIKQKQETIKLYEENKNKKMKIDVNECGLEKNEEGQYISKSNFPKTLTSQDIGKKLGDSLDVVIIKGTLEKLPDGNKYVLELSVPSFEVKDEDEEKADDGIRRLILNKTNLSRLMNKYGTELDDWEGKKIELHREDTMYQGKPTECIRVSY